MKKLLLILIMIVRFPLRIFSKISPFSIIKNSKIEKNAAVSYGSRVYGSRIGRYTYVGKKTTICNTDIGSFCSIADYCTVSPGKHPAEFVSTSPVFYSKHSILRKCFHETPFNEFDHVTIGNDVWIGSHAFIKGGVTIGDGAIIGAYSVVTKSIEPYEIVAGNPSKLIKKRFSDQQIGQLIESQWWNKPDAELYKISENFNNVEAFLLSSRGL